MPKTMKIYLNLLQLRIVNHRLFFPGHGVLIVKTIEIHRIVPVRVRSSEPVNKLTTNALFAVNKDLQKMGFTWEEAEVAALDRYGWRRSVAQCVQLHAG